MWCHLKIWYMYYMAIKLFLLSLSLSSSDYNMPFPLLDTLQVNISLRNLWHGYFYPWFFQLAPNVSLPTSQIAVSRIIVRASIFNNMGQEVFESIIHQVLCVYYRPSARIDVSHNIDLHALKCYASNKNVHIDSIWAAWTVWWRLWVYGDLQRLRGMIRFRCI